MNGPGWNNSKEPVREHTGVAEGLTTLLTVSIIVAAYLFQSSDGHSELLVRSLFLIGTLVICATIIHGVLFRHYLPNLSPLIAAGAFCIGLSQVTTFLASRPAFDRLPIIGREGWGYLVHHDDMLLYPGAILMMGGFYIAMLRAARLRQELVREGQEKERALRLSQESAETLARRVAFENLATGISTQFINMSHDEIDRGIDRSLAELGQFAGVDRAYITFSRLEEGAPSENFEWCAPGVPSFRNAMAEATLADFHWSIGKLSRGESIRVARLDALPPEAAFERGWFDAEGTKSVLNVPIISSRTLHGYIGFDAVNAEKAWPDETEPLLRMIGEILLSAWDRRCAEQQRRLLELQVNQARKLESLGVMAGGIAHDFNNLLTGIMGNAELAQLDTPRDSDNYRYLNGVIQSSRRAAELCRQMLAYAGRGRFLTQPVDLNTQIKDLMPMLRASLPAGADVALELKDDLPTVSGDAGQFRQLVENLLVNAAEALEGDRGTVYVRTGCRHCNAAFFRGTYLSEPVAAGEYVFLEIRDTGSGMPADVKEKVFEPFFTTRFAGRGLGLPAVLGIVRSHKGALRIDTEVGAGTTVQVLFPVDGAAADRDPIPGEVQGGWHGRGTVLLADDEDLVLSVGTMMLRHLGLDVVTAVGGDEAVARAVEHGPALRCAILDFDMPGSQIEATCEALRRSLPHLPIVIASGHAEGAVSERLAREGIAAFLPKPFELSALEAVMRDLLDSAPGGK